MAYVHDSSQGQFVSETYFVMMMYGLVILGVILLCEAGTLDGEKFVEATGPGVRFLVLEMFLCRVGKTRDFKTNITQWVLWIICAVFNKDLKG